MFVRELTWDKCMERLPQARLARLACTSENQPYVVPVYLVYQAPFLYGFMTLGQKVEWMRSNPRVCVELDDVKSFDHWTSVIIVGRYEELTDSPEWGQERLRAYALLQKNVEWWARRRRRRPPRLGLAFPGDLLPHSHRPDNRSPGRARSRRQPALSTLTPSPPWLSPW